MKAALLLFLLIIAVFVSGFEGAKWISLILALAGVILSYAYIRAGRWQAAPLFVVAFLFLFARTNVGDAGLPIWLEVAALLLLVGAGGVLYLLPVPHLTTPTGPYTVGLRRVEINVHRRLLMYIWYPASASGVAPARRYHSKEEAAVLSTGLKAAGAPGFFNDHYRLASTHTFDNAPVEIDRFPVIVFNHGGGLFPTQNSSLMQELASHGYVCISVGHPGESAGLLWENGAIASLKPEVIADMKVNEEFQRDNLEYLVNRERDESIRLFETLAAHTDNGLTRLTKLWAKDTFQALKALGAGQVDDAHRDLVSACDFDKRAYIGMSLGGSVSHLCCHDDPGASAGINIDGMNWIFSKAEEPLNVPFLQFYNDPNSIRAAAQRELEREIAHVELSPALDLYNHPYFQKATKGSVCLLIPNLGHMGFTDAALGARGLFRVIMGLGQSATRTQTDRINRLIRLFLDVTLKGAPLATFDDEVDGYVRENKLIRLSE